MKAYTTEELNKELDKPCWVDEKLARVNREKMIGWMIANGHRKQDKPFGKPYASKGGAIFTFIDQTTVFGFNASGKWVSAKISEPLSSNLWQPYPQEKWEAMLLDYAKSRGYKNGNYKCLFQPKTVEVKLDTFFIGDDGCVYHGDAENVIYNQVFDGKTGVWAEIIEVPEYTWEKIKEILGHEFTIKN